MAAPLLLLSAAPELLALLVLAVVQGISEFLPISSDGHLSLVQEWMDFEGPRFAIDVALHLGTFFSVLVVFRREISDVLRRALAGDWSEPRLILIGTLPTAVIGLGMRDVVAELFESPRAAALGLLVTAGFLLVGERARRRAERAPAGDPAAPRRELDWRDALWIGTLQSLAILPGVSRSGTTIATALTRGVEARRAAHFSFLMSIPAVGGAVLLEAPDLVREGGFGVSLAVALAACFVTGVLALRFLLAFLGRGAFLWCAAYCLVLGSVVLALL